MSAPAPPRPVLHLLMVTSATLVSTSFTVGEAIAGDLDPAVLTLLRFLLASVLLAPVIHLRYGLRPNWSLIGRSALISCCLVLFFWCMFWALRYTSALNTSVIFTLVPSISGVFATFLVGERLSRPQFLALGFGLAGALWVIFRGDIQILLAMAWNRGDLIFLFGCFFMALYTPLVKLLYRGESMLLMTFWVLVTGSVWLLIFGANKLQAVDWGAVRPMVWWALLYLAVFTTVITFFLTQYCTPHLGAIRAMAYSYLYPGLVLLIDLGLGKGLPPLKALPGIGIVLLAMVVLQYSSFRREQRH